MNITSDDLHWYTSVDNRSLMGWDAHRYFSPRALRRARPLIVQEPARLPVSCGDRTRYVTVLPDGAIALDHTDEEVRAMTALEVIGEDPCPCIQLRRELIRARRWSNLRSCLTRIVLARSDYQRRKLFKPVLGFYDLMIRVRRVRYIFRYTHRTACTPERETVLGNLRAEVLRLIGSGPGLNVQVGFFSEYAMHIPELAAGKLRTTRVRCSGERYSAINVDISLGIDFIMRYRAGKWYAFHPADGKSYLVLGMRDIQFDGMDAYEAVILVPRRWPSSYKTLFKRVIMDRDNRILAYAQPIGHIFRAFSAVDPSLGPEVSPPTRIIRVKQRRQTHAPAGLA